MQRALIIGGSRGLGLGLVREHLARGWHVTATQRGASAELEALAREFDGRLILETLDITSVAQAQALSDRLAGQSFDLLFLNAGIMAGRGADLRQVPDDDIHAIFLTNAISPIRVADTLARHVRPGGMIAFMSSILGSIGTNDDGRAELYRASKAALNMIVHTLGYETAKKSVIIAAISPGSVDTKPVKGELGYGSNFKQPGAGQPGDSVAGIIKVIAGLTPAQNGEFLDYKDGRVIPW